jgi:putative ABC transport system permease protein
VLRHGMLLTLIGVGIGLAGSRVLAGLLAGLLYGIAPTDLATFAAMVLVFAAVAFVATYIPARRAALIDPTIAFREE